MPFVFWVVRDSDGSQGMRHVVTYHIGHFYMLFWCRTRGMSLLLARDRRTRTGIPKTMAGSLFMVGAACSQRVVVLMFDSTCRYRGEGQTRGPSGCTREVNRVAELPDEGPSPPIGGDTGLVGQV